MNTKAMASIVVVAIVVVSAVAVYVIYSGDDSESYEYVPLESNEDVFQIEEFDLMDEKTGSWIRGTLYAMNGDDGYPLIRVMATVHVAPGNYYGASISGLLNFVPVRVLTNYHGDPNSTDVIMYSFHDPDSHAVFGTSFTQREFFGIDEPVIGPDIPIGGDGTVIVDLGPSEHFDQTSKLYDWSVAIHIGSEGNSSPIMERILIYHDEVNAASGKPYVTRFPGGDPMEQREAPAVSTSEQPTTSGPSQEVSVDDGTRTDGIVKITRDQLIRYGPMAGLSIDALLSTGQEVFYFAPAPSCAIKSPDGRAIETEPYRTGFSWAWFAEFCAMQEAASSESISKTGVSSTPRLLI